MNTLIALDQVDNIIQSAEIQIGVILNCNVKLIMSSGKERRITPDLLKAIICEVMNVKWKDVIGEKKTVELATARQLYCYFGKELFRQLSINKIADELKYAHHSTVISSKKRLLDMLYTKDEYMTEKVNMVKEKLRQ